MQLPTRVLKIVEQSRSLLLEAEERTVHYRHRPHSAAEPLPAERRVQLESITSIHLSRSISPQRVQRLKASTCRSVMIRSSNLMRHSMQPSVLFREKQTAAYKL